MRVTRRNFVKLTGAAGSCLFLPACGLLQQRDLPPYLKGYEKLYRQDPKSAALQWFKDAKFGLFIHWGLYSLLGRHEWVMYDEAIPVGEYEQLRHRFTAERFDAGFIADLALETGMQYITFVCKHCDSFCLWDTACTGFNSMNSAAGRDFVAEMTEACHDRGLGFFAFYEHGFDWRHPHGPSPWDWKSKAVRPHYNPPEASYKYGVEYDFGEYLDYVHCGITELLTRYGPLAGIWLDGIGVPLSGDWKKFECEELYRHIRRLQPQTLISYKFGLTGTEDFLAPEEVQLNRKEVDLDNREKPWEICTSLHDGGSTGHKLGWGYVEDARRFSLEQNLEKIDYAREKDANLLLNIGPLGDGSVHPDDIEMLKAIGTHIKT